MCQLVGGTVFGLAAATFVEWDDPILGILLVVCAIVWVASALIPLEDTRMPKRSSVLRLE